MKYLYCGGDIAQLVEHLPCKQEALGSIPSISNFSHRCGGDIAQLVEHLPCKQEAMGLIPGNSKFFPSSFLFVNMCDNFSTLFVDTYCIVTEDENGQNVVHVPYYYADRLVASSSVQMSATKARRLAQEIATLSTSLPLSPSSSVFVKCDEEQLDVMKVGAFKSDHILRLLNVRT